MAEQVILQPSRMPHTLPVQPDRIAPELTGGRRHVAWNWKIANGKPTKPPINPDTGKFADSTAPSTWGTFAEALERMRLDGLPGIGIVLIPTDDLAGIDLDHCVDPETQEIEREAQAIIQTFLPTYAEYSPSGTGVRIFVHGKLDGKRYKVGNMEVYETERYLTMTGHPIPGAAETVAERQDALSALCRRLAAQGAAAAPAASVQFTDEMDDAAGEAILQRIRPQASGIRRANALTQRIWDLAHDESDLVTKQTDRGPVPYAGESERRHALVCALYEANLNDDEVKAAFKATCRWRKSVAAHGEREAERRLTTQDMRKAKGFVQQQRDLADQGQWPTPIRPDIDGTESDEAGSNRNGTGRAKESERLLALTEGVELFHTPEGVAYVRYERGGHRETRSLGRGSAFRDWLATEAYRAFGKIPGDKAINEVVMLCRAKAMEAEPARAVVTRVGAANGKIYVDLADPDWRAVEIDTDGWRVVTEPPVHFRRANGMLPLPEPVSGGSLDELRILVNVGNDQDWTLMIGWLLMTMHPDGPYPHLAIHGEQGSAKSTTTRLLKSLIDPSQAPTRAQPKDEQDIAIGARNCRVLAFDNLSSMPAWFSDGLCRLSTGAGLATRQLYTDDEESTFYGKNPVIFNAIAEIAARGDLISRTVIIALPTIEGTGKRMGEREVSDMFADARPRILGALYDAVSGALRNLPTTHLADPPRMADFATWVAAAEPALKWEPGTFTEAYAENRTNAVGIELDASPLVSTLMAFVEEQKWWQGTTTELLKELTNKADLATTHLRDWPKQPNVLSGELRRLAPALRTQGIGVQLPERRRAGDGHARLLRLHKISAEAV